MAVPVFGVLSGPKLQILAAENLMQGTNLHMAPHSWIYMLAAFIALPLLFILLFGSFNTYGRIAGLLLLASGIEFLGYRLYADQHILLDTASLLVTLLATGIIVTLADVSIKSVLLNLSHRHGKSISDLLDTIVRDSLTGIVIIGANGRIISISQQAGAMLARFGYDAKKGDLFAGALPWEFGRKIADCLKSRTAADPLECPPPLVRHAQRKHPLFRILDHAVPDCTGWQEAAGRGQGGHPALPRHHRLLP